MTTNTNNDATESSDDNGKGSARSRLSLSRRRVLAMIPTGTIASLAGCNDELDTVDDMDDDPADDDEPEADDDDEPADQIEDLDDAVERIEQLEAELQETREVLNARSEALEAAFGNAFVQPGDTRIVPDDETLSGIVGENGIVGRLGEEAIPGDTFIEAIERGLAISMQENGIPGGMWDPYDDTQFPGDTFIPGGTWVDVMGGENGLVGRLGEEAFPGDTFIEGIERGLTVSMQENGFPGDTMDIYDDTQFPGGMWFPGDTMVDVMGGEDGLVGRLGEEAFPGDMFIEGIERGLAVSMQEDGFPGDTMDIHDDTLFPGDTFIPGDTFVEVSQSTGPLPEAIDSIDTQLTTIERDVDEVNLEPIEWEPIEVEPIEYGD